MLDMNQRWDTCSTIEKKICKPDKLGDETSSFLLFNERDRSNSAGFYIHQKEKADQLKISEIRVMNYYSYFNFNPEYCKS